MFSLLLFPICVCLFTSTDFIILSCWFRQVITFLYLVISVLICFVCVPVGSLLFITLYVLLVLSSFAVLCGLCLLFMTLFSLL